MAAGRQGKADADYIIYRVKAGACVPAFLLCCTHWIVHGDSYRGGGYIEQAASTETQRQVSSDYRVNAWTPPAMYATQGENCIVIYRAHSLCCAPLLRPYNRTYTESRDSAGRSCARLYTRTIGRHKGKSRYSKDHPPCFCLWRFTLRACTEVGGSARADQTTPQGRTQPTYNAHSFVYGCPMHRLCRHKSETTAAGKQSRILSRVFEDN